MNHIFMSELQEEVDFVKRAAEAFKADSTLFTWTDEGPKKGCFMGLRWGADGDGVVVVKLDDSHVPTNYQRVLP